MSSLLTKIDKTKKWSKQGVGLVINGEHNNVNITQNYGDFNSGQSGALKINDYFFADQKNKFKKTPDLASAYYGGKKDVQWYGIVIDLDVKRKAYDAIKEKITQGFDNVNAVAALVKGDGGSGKSVLLRRLAHDLRMDYRIYWLQDIESFLVGEWLHEISTQDKDKSLVFIEDWYQHIENSQLIKEANELLANISRLTHVRLVIGDRFANNKNRKEYEVYVSQQVIFELKADENLTLLERIFEKIPQWKEKLAKDKINNCANASLFQLLFVFQYANDFDGSITDVYQRIFYSDCRDLMERNTSVSFWRGVAKSLYFYAHLYGKEGVVFTPDFFLDLCAYFGECTVPDRFTIKQLVNDKTLKKYLGLDVKQSKLFGEISFFRFHHDTMADKGWMTVDAHETYNDELLQGVIDYFQKTYPFIIRKIYYNRIKQGGDRGKNAARACLQTENPWESQPIFNRCLNLLKGEEIAKEKARGYLITDHPWESHQVFCGCLNLLKDEEIAKEKARGFLGTEYPWGSYQVFCSCLNLLKDEETSKKKAQEFLETDKPWESHAAFNKCLNLLKDEEIAKEKARDFLGTEYPWGSYQVFCSCLNLLKDEEASKKKAQEFLETDKPWESHAAFSSCLNLLKDDQEGIDNAVFVLEKRKEFKAAHHWPLIYRSLMSLCDKTNHRPLVEIVANEIIKNKTTMIYQYTQLLKIPLFSVPEWVEKTNDAIENWKKINIHIPNMPWVSRNIIYSITISYKNKPDLLKGMCLGIIFNWKFELRVDQKHQAYFVRCLAHPDIQSDKQIREDVICECKKILNQESQLQLRISDGTRVWLQNIMDRGHFPEWDYCDLN